MERLDPCAELLRIGEAGREPRGWLDDDDPGVRGCAALAPALAADGKATGVLCQLAASARAFDRALGFGGDSPALRHFTGPQRWALAEAVCVRAEKPRDLLQAACAARSVYRRARRFRRTCAPSSRTGGRGREA
ncbi:hypothetical protein Ais01nite_05620 [Asanoa ishikariensis]|nr:hypothetical protein [Asanoa ishikariensis]GIF62527.1 hypothetical protein Ais01nite_05620 [Asanoa ishikariensis]